MPKPKKDIVLTLKNRLVRLLSDPSQQIKQGALEFNAFLIKNLVTDMQQGESEDNENAPATLPAISPEQRKTALSILYLNLIKLASSVDTYTDETIERHKLMTKLDMLQNQGNTDHAELIKLIMDGYKSAPDGLRLNQLAKLCSSAENFIELDAEQALYHEYDRSSL